MIERLLVPIAGDALDARALKVSIDLARQLGAAITGVIVEPFPSAPSALGLSTRADEHGEDAALRAHANHLLASFAERAREAGVPFQGLATQGSNIADAILAAAADHRCDMIVMATHARRGIAWMLSGSHTRDVMARTTLPVLVLQ